MSDLVDEMVGRQSGEIRASHTIGDTGVRTRPVPYHDIRDRLLELPHVHDGYVTSDIFTERHDFLRQLHPAPQSFFEFGCLRGYFLVTAWDACPGTKRMGWIDNESHTIGSNLQAHANIVDYGARHSELSLPQLWWDTVAYRSADFGQADVASVDGDHSYEGCLSDLIWARRMQPQVILVDDYRAHLLVQLATRHFISLYGWYLDERETVNGLAILTPP